MTIPYTLTNLLEQYIIDRSPAYATHAHIRGIINKFTADTGIDLVTDIDKTVIDQWKQHIKKTANPVTCNNYLRHMKTLLSCAVENKWITVNLFKETRMFRVPNVKKKIINVVSIRENIRFLGEKEQAKLPGWFWVIVIQTLYHTGIRRRQLVNLRWKDINYKDKTILLRVEGSKTLREWDIPLTPEVEEGFNELEEKTREVVGIDTDISDDQMFKVSLFNKRYRSEELTQGQVSCFFQRLSVKSDHRVSAHRFRHRLATELANRNHNLKAVQELLGHTCLATTMGYITPDMNQLNILLSDVEPL